MEIVILGYRIVIITYIRHSGKICLNFSTHFHFIYLRIRCMKWTKQYDLTKSLYLCKHIFFSKHFWICMQKKKLCCWCAVGILGNTNLERKLKATDLSYFIFFFLSAGLISLYAQIQSWWRDKRIAKYTCGVVVSCVCIYVFGLSDVRYQWNVFAH